jgi:Do/DeqQ family serine protease
MRKLLCLFFIGCLFHSFAFAGSPPLSLAPMIEKASPAVVNIRAQIKVSDLETYLRLQKDRQIPGHKNIPIPRKMISQGSGVIVNAAKGFILTNAHVVDDAQNVMVTLNDGRHFNAKIIGLDKPSDIALLQIQAKSLAELPISNNKDDLKVGDVVVAIGNPFGLNQSVTSGIVSALGRTSLGIENYENFIQTDTSINPGNSGGALINTSGQLIGINTAILAPNQGSIGIGFAIPADMAKSVMQQLIQYGDVRRGALGVGAQNITPELAAAFHLSSTKGAVITLVMPNSPAEQVGMQSGDIITAVNDSPVKNANDVVNTIAFLRVNTEATINITRNSKPMTFHIQVTDPKKRKEMNEKMNPFLYGLGLRDIHVESPIHGSVSGVLVLSVEEDSNAWRADLLPGDVIVSANQQKITDIASFKKIVASAKDDLLLNILRNSGAAFVVVNKEQ